jgi:PTH1 family peptidyl-tRNA hydrolase
MVNDEACWLLKPETYMNLSGAAVAAIVRTHGINPECMLVVHDEIDLEVGTVRLKFGGGPGGHNGLKDIIGRLGHGDFFRLRIGVGHPGSRAAVTSYLLDRVDESDRAAILAAIGAALAHAPQIVRGEMSQVMNKLNRRRKPVADQTEDPQAAKRPPRGAEQEQ